VPDFINPRFCRNPEQFGDGTVAALKLHTNRPTWYLRDELPWMKRAELEACIQRAADGWTTVADFKAVRAANEASALWVFTVARMDGAGGVLADAQLPGGQRQQICRIDIAENALAHLLEVILRHEIGHLAGLQHFPANPPPELMEPSLNPKVTMPQATEAALMVQWYGKPITQAPPPPVTPTSGLTCVVRLADDGKTIGCEIEAAKPGFVANLKGVKTWAPAPTSGLHVAGHPVQALPIEQPEEFDVPEKWRSDPDDPTDIMDEGDLT
jgi:hypothetical protein